MIDKERLLDEIAERELQMFLASPGQGGEAQFQNRPEIFKLTRRMAHSAHDNEFLEAYLEDLREAAKNGRNFMREKYGYDNPQRHGEDSSLVDEIADAEMLFLNQAASLYPDIIRHKASEEYRQYLRAELETLSPKSLELYAAEIRKDLANGCNPALERHNWLAAQLGKPLLVAPE